MHHTELRTVGFWRRARTAVAGGAALIAMLASLPAEASPSSASPVTTSQSPKQLALPPLAEGGFRAPDDALGRSWANSSDRAVTVAGDSAGLHVLVAAERDRFVWHSVATLNARGIDAASWTGYVCQTGSGRFAAVSFAPTAYANSPVLRDRGAFAAIVDLDTNTSTVLRTRVALKYHTPACGPDNQVTFTRNLGTDQSSTEVLSVDAQTAKVSADLVIAGQVTSIVGDDAGLWGVAGGNVVRIGNDAKVTQVAVTSGQPFDLHPSARGGLDLLVADHSSTALVVHATHVTESRTEVLASGPAGQLNLYAGRAGRNFLVGGNLPRTVGGIAGDANAVAVSLDGHLQVESVRTDPSRAEAWPSIDDSTRRVDARATASAVTTSDVVGLVGRLVSADLPGETWMGPGGTTASSTTTPTCAVGRNNFQVQVRQPTDTQIEWAIDLAVHGVLTVARPANWMYNGTTTGYTPQGLFPLPGLDGTASGTIPAPVLLGIVAQESNLKQASYHALAGVPGNPLIADYYGAGGGTTRVDYDNADCGYGLGQVTDNMRAADTGYTANQKKAAATDFAANITATARMLSDKWNQLSAMRLYANPKAGNVADSTFVENWYFAIWAYNTGVHANLNDGSPYGLGWTNNPANADYVPTRGAFLRNGDYTNASHPADWAYQERVFGWMAHPQLEPGGASKYQSVSGWADLSQPGPFQFCATLVDSCDPNYHATPSSLSYCTRGDRQCWWHTPADTADTRNTWISALSLIHI